MKIGLSTYSLSRAIRDGRLSVLDAIDWVAENGGQHVEIVPAGFALEEDADLVTRIKERVRSAGLELSSYTIGANFLTGDEAARGAEIQRVKRHVDIGAELGVKLMRHDAGTRAPAEATFQQFAADLPILADACREVADYAAQFGITTSVENHGFHCQASDRVHALVDAVDRKNFRTTIDIGNFLCADEDPVAGVGRNVGVASMIHVKDFYRRYTDEKPSDGWFQSMGGVFLRGAVVGQGDLDIPKLLRIVKHAGYDGYLSVEFEGLEDCFLGSKAGMEATRRIWERQ
jgi:sugar phosphate isomerase/epimerase